MRLCVHAVELTHTGAQVAFDGFHNDMKVVVHQAVGVAEPVMAGTAKRLGSGLNTVRLRRFSQLRIALAFAEWFKIKRPNLTVLRLDPQSL